MEQFNWKEFYEHQVGFYTKEVEFYDRQIESLTRQLDRRRKEDRETTEYVWNRGVLTEIEMEIWGDGKYESVETHKILLERRKYYLNRKRDRNKLENYKRHLAEM